MLRLTVNGGFLLSPPLGGCYLYLKYLKYLKYLSYMMVTVLSQFSDRTIAF